MAVAVEKIKAQETLALTARKKVMRAGPDPNLMTIARQIRSEAVRKQQFAPIDEAVYYWLMSNYAGLNRTIMRIHNAARSGAVIEANGDRISELLGKEEGEQITEPELRTLSMSRKVLVNRERGYKLWGEFTIADLEDRKRHLGGILHGYQRSIGLCQAAIEAIKSAGVTTLAEALGDSSTTTKPTTAAKTQRLARAK